MNIVEYTDSMSERQFRSTTGYSKIEFRSLYPLFEESFKEEYGYDYADYLIERVTEEVKLKTLKSCLLFVLFQYKNDLIYDSLGAVFNMSGSTAHDNFTRYSSLLEKTLKKKGLS